EGRRTLALRQVKYLNNVVEQDHRNIKRLTSPGLGFGSFWTARRTLAGYEAMAMIKKGQVRNINGRDMKAHWTASCPSECGPAEPGHRLSASRYRSSWPSAPASRDSPRRCRAE